MVCRVWLEMFLGVRASEVSDVVAEKQQAQCGCCAGPKSLFRPKLPLDAYAMMAHKMRANTKGDTQ